MNFLITYKKNTYNKKIINIVFYLLKQFNNSMVTAANVITPKVLPIIGPFETEHLEKQISLHKVFETLLQQRHCITTDTNFYYCSGQKLK